MLSCFLSIVFFIGNVCLKILIALVFTTFISIPQHRPTQLVYQLCPVLPILPQPVAQGHQHILQCKLIFLYSKVSKPFKSFVGMILTVQVKHNQLQTPSLSNSSSNLHTSSLSLVQSYFNTLIHLQFPDKSSFVPVNMLFRICINLVVYMLKCCLLVYEAHNSSCHIQSSS